MIIYEGTIVSLTDKFGFMRVYGFKRDVYFRAENLKDGTFNNLAVGDQVDIVELIKTHKGYWARKIYVKY